MYVYGYIKEFSVFDVYISRFENCLWTIGNYGFLLVRSNIIRMEFIVILLRFINIVRVGE